MANLKAEQEQQIVWKNGKRKNVWFFIALASYFLYEIEDG